MRDIIIDEEFRDLLPALDSETYSLLEENILENGCRDALVLWNGILIDGYNRYSICVKHNIPFKTADIEFSSREEVLIWIISTQVARRNLSPMQLTHLRGLHYRADKALKGRYDRNDHKHHNDVYAVPTSKKLGEKYNVSSSTIDRDAKVSEAIDAIGEISAEAKRKVLSGEVNIDKKVLEKLSLKPKEDIAEKALEIESGTYKKNKQDSESSAKWPVETAVAKITKELLHDLRKHAEEDDPAELKTTLRTYINTLEELYNAIQPNS